ncbi:MAG: anaerobic sulfatase maturase [Dehalococcoidia bacterium]|nr:MAG: anaerobic sulfatase maturase [Dehalococcoidia bacterium]
MTDNLLDERPRTSEPFVVMAKPVGPICNLDCGYCYYLDTAQFYGRPHQFRMSDELLETYVRQYIEASPGPIVHFVWHGGEPTLAGLDFYRRAVELEQRYLPEGWTCWNNLQTNGTLLDDEWCAFLAEAHFDVGISIDGTAWLHDAYRKDRNGEGTYERVLAGARRLQAHGIQPDLLCTVNSAVAAEPVAVYRGLREVGSGWMQFIPIVRRGPDGRVTPDSVQPEAYGRFLSAVFDEWMHHDVGRLNVQFFAETMRVWAGGTASLCVMTPTCGRVVVVEHDGAVYACDHFVTPEHRIGNLGDVHLGALIDAPRQVQFGAEKRDGLPGQCRSCPWLTVCNGGCPKDRFTSTADGEPGLNYLCEGFRRFYAHAERPAQYITARVRSGVRAGVIMEELRAQSRLRWQGVGRNDPCICGSGRKAKQCCWLQRP